MKQRTLTILVG